jgi:hypothetical protein
MCHEQWWRERRARRAEEAREVWEDFDRTPPSDEPPVPDEKPRTVLADVEEDLVATDR